MFVSIDVIDVLENLVLVVYLAIDAILVAPKCKDFNKEWPKMNSLLRKGGSYRLAWVYGLPEKFGLSPRSREEILSSKNRARSVFRKTKDRQIWYRSWSRSCPKWPNFQWEAVGRW